jgi:hypothetical protein
MHSITVESNEKGPSPIASHLSRPPSDNLQNYPPPSVLPGRSHYGNRTQQPMVDLEGQEPGVTSPPVAATAAPPHSYHPLSWPVITLLALPSVLGLLARLGIHSLTTYEGDSVFALAWVQGMGCFIMGLALGKRQTITDLYVKSIFIHNPNSHLMSFASYPPLYTAITTGLCPCIIPCYSQN